MAKVLEQFEFRGNGNGGSKLPWTEWSDGKIRQLTRGEDFPCKAITVASGARKYAKDHGLKVKVSHHKGTDVVVLQFIRDAAPTPATPKKTKSK